MLFERKLWRRVIALIEGLVERHMALGEEIGYSNARMFSGKFCVHRWSEAQCMQKQVY